MKLESYRILRPLGSGATSEVFAALPPGSEIPIAIKRFSTFVCQDPDMRARLRHEVDALRSLQHPNIVQLIRVIEEEQAFALELELVEGDSLSGWAKNYNLPLIEPKIRVLAEIATALAAAHEKQILHRDIKPENVLISKKGEVKLTDFGLARSLSRVTVTKTGLLVGSLAYMAPEIIDMDDSTEKSDIFSFGVLAYELLTNARPFPGDTPQAIIRQIALGNPRAPRELSPLVPKAIAATITACLSTKPEARPRSIWHVHAELMSALHESGVSSFCAPLSTDDFREILGPAMRAKRERLLKKVARLKVQNAPLAEKIDTINELSILFPEDPAAETLLEESIISHTNTAEPVSRKQRWIAALLLLIFIGAGIVSLAMVHFRPKSAVVELPPPPAPIVQQETKATPVPEPESEPERIIVKKIDYGFIRFIAPAEAGIFVDDVYVPQKSRARLRVRAGRRQVRLQMKGFLPIRNFIDVEKDRLITINVGDEQ